MGEWSIIFIVLAYVLCCWSFNSAITAEGADVHLPPLGVATVTPVHTSLLSESVAIPERHQVTAADQQRCPPPFVSPEVCLHRQVNALLWRRRRRRNDVEVGVVCVHD